jgi:hypothetical protein
MTAAPALLLRTDHFSVDGTLVEAWASMKSFRPKDGSANSRRRVAGGTARRISTPEALQRDARFEDRSGSSALSQGTGQGREAKLSFMGHAPMENRNGFVVDVCLTEANAMPSGSE